MASINLTELANAGSAAILEERARLGRRAEGTLTRAVDVEKRTLHPDEQRQVARDRENIEKLTELYEQVRRREQPSHMPPAAVLSWGDEQRDAGDYEGRYAELPPTLAAELRAGKPGAWLAAELRSIQTGSGLGAAITPTQYADRLFDRLAAKSVGLQSGFTQLNTDGGEVVLPHLTSAVGASWTAEATAITPSVPGGEGITATPRKLAALVRASREAIDDSMLNASTNAVAVIENAIVRDLALGLDLGFYEGSGTPPEITGLKNVSGIGTVSMGTNGAAFSNLDPIVAAIGQVSAANAEATAIVMHPRTWSDLLGLKEIPGSSIKPLLTAGAGSPVDGVARTILGVPVYLSGQISVTETQGSASNTSSVYVYEAEQVVAVRRLDTRLEIDFSQYFGSDEVAIRAVCRYDLAVPNAAAVVRIKGVKPAS